MVTHEIDSQPHNSRAAFLIDGHHVFLETVSQVKTYRELMSDSAIAEATIPDAYFRSLGFAENPTEAVTTFTQALEGIDNADIALVDLLYPGLAFSELADRLELYWFDAEMPPIHELWYKLKVSLRKIGQGPATYFKAPINIQSWLERLEADEFEFYHDERSIVVPYRLKNDFIGEMEKTTFPGVVAPPGFGWRDFRVNKQGQLKYGEKAVDSALVIQACDLANEPGIDSVCFVTNDGDYVPAVERLRQRGKRVFAYSLAPNQSHELRKATGDGMHKTLHNVMSRREPPEAKIAAFGKEIAARLEACPIFWKLHSRMIRDLSSLKETGMTACARIRHEAIKAAEAKLGHRIEYGKPP